MSVSEMLSKILHTGSQALLVPTLVCLILLVCVVVFCIGSLVVEFLTERRHFKVNQRKVIIAMRRADYRDIPDVIMHADLLKSQVAALLGIARNMGLPDDELFALSKAEMDRNDARYRRRVNLTDTISKIAPLMGLMGTLIPLGPGIVAMGRGDVSLLSNSLLVAFDTTIAGLVVAIVALVVSRIRRTWYAQYASALKVLSACILEEAARAREEGVELPYGYDADPLVELAAPAPAVAPEASAAPVVEGAARASVPVEERGLL